MAVDAAAGWVGWWLAGVAPPWDIHVTFIFLAQLQSPAIAFPARRNRSSRQSLVKNRPNRFERRSLHRMSHLIMNLNGRKRGTDCTHPFASVIVLHSQPGSARIAMRKSKPPICHLAKHAEVVEEDHRHVRFRGRSSGIVRASPAT